MTFPKAIVILATLASTLGSLAAPLPAVGREDRFQLALAEEHGNAIIAEELHARLLKDLVIQHATNLITNKMGGNPPAGHDQHSEHHDAGPEHNAHAGTVDRSHEHEDHHDAHSSHEDEAPPPNAHHDTHGQPPSQHPGYPPHPYGAHPAYGYPPPAHPGYAPHPYYPPPPPPHYMPPHYAPPPHPYGYHFG